MLRIWLLIKGFLNVCLFVKATSNTVDLNWMHQIELADNYQQQNLEIIYNNNQVYYKTIKTIFKNEKLAAFPSKDLEISLGLQFVPCNKGNFLFFFG